MGHSQADPVGRVEKRGGSGSYLLHKFQVGDSIRIQVLFFCNCHGFDSASVRLFEPADPFPSSSLLDFIDLYDRIAKI